MCAAMEAISALPDDTRIFCGHEYTVANLEWASKVESLNPAIGAKLEEARKARAEGKFTVPSVLAEEREFNVFMRAGQLTALLGEPDAVAVMNRLREMKNSGQTLV